MALAQRISLREEFLLPVTLLPTALCLLLAARRPTQYSVRCQSTETMYPRDRREERLHHEDAIKKVI